MKKGFTLIELLIVITIIGTLASVGSTSFLNAIKYTRDIKRIYDLNILERMLFTYKIINDTFPDINKWKELEELLGFSEKGIRPPKPEDAYCYYISKDKKQALILAKKIELPKNLKYSLNGKVNNLLKDAQFKTGILGDGRDVKCSLDLICGIKTMNYCVIAK